MHYSDEHFEMLKAYEEHFGTAIRSSWARGISHTMLESLRRIYEETTGKPYPMRGSCMTCQLHLLQDAGALYFQDKEERERCAREAAIIEKAGKEAERRKKEGLVENNFAPGEKSISKKKRVVKTTKK